jgi:hypothetical protein
VTPGMPPARGPRSTGARSRTPSTSTRSPCSVGTRSFDNPSRRPLG